MRRLVALCLLLLAPLGACAAPPPVVRWDFTGGDARGWQPAHDLRLEQADGALRAAITGPDPYLHSPPLAVDGPLVARVRLRSGGSGQGRFYWRLMLPSLVPSAWSEAASIYFAVTHDGQWHEYTVPIEAEGRVVALRFDPGNPGASGRTADIAWIELNRPADEDVAGGRLARSAPPIAIAAGPLALRLDRATGTYTVADRRTRRVWRTLPPRGLRLVGARRLGPCALEADLRQPAGGGRFRCRVQVAADATVTFRLTGDPGAAIDRLRYPGALAADLPDGELAFCNRSCGQLIGQREEYPARGFAVYGNLGLDMPWIGALSAGRGDGVATLFETPCDAAVELRADAAGRQWPQPVWIASMGLFAGERRLSWRFEAAGGYVAQARGFRRWAARHGMLVTLREKARTRPNVRKLLGAPSVWGASFDNGKPPVTVGQFAREAAAAGMDRGIVNGNGAFARAENERLTALGFLTGDYDNYDDIRQGPLAITSDDVQRVAIRCADGSLARGWVNDDGSQMYRRSSSWAVEAARAIVTPLLAKHRFTARFLDVSSTVDLMEDYNPARRSDRRADMANRRALYRFIASLGLVVGGEHGKAWNADVVDYTEGMMSGPFWWEMPAGYLKVPASRADIRANYLRYGINPAARIPLWELVFHDCVVTTWYWGDSTGYYHALAPELSDRKDLCNMLYGTVPLLWINHLDYGWNRNRSRLLETVRLTCNLHRAVGDRAMVGHAFLSPDRMLQESRFAGGGRVIVNFADAPRSVSTPDGRLTLAPRGFWARAGALRQTRLMEAGAPVTRLVSPAALSFESRSRRALPWLDAAGRVSAVARGPRAWRLIVESVGPARLRARALPGLAVGRLTARTLAADGTPIAPLPVSRDGAVQLPEGEGIRLVEVAAAPPQP